MCFHKIERNNEHISLPVVHLDGNVYIKIRYFQIAFDIGNILNSNVNVRREHGPLIIRIVHHMIHNVRHM